MLLFFVSACSKGYGNKLTDDSIDVYFDSKEDEILANNLGKFWKKKGLTGEKKQSIRLINDDEYFQVQIIANDPKSVDKISFNELKLLLDLQTELDTTVFKGKNSCQIVICDNTFKPIFNINH